jgi:hypothetical protein
VTGPARPATAAPPGPGASQAGELDMGMLMLAYPQFAITAIPGRRRVRREIVRRNSADPGLYAVITDDLAEAYAALAADAPPAACLPPANSPEGARP